MVSKSEKQLTHTLAIYSSGEKPVLTNRGTVARWKANSQKIEKATWAHFAA
jgi:hypothetical protein